MNRRDALRRASFAVGATAVPSAVLSLLQSCQSEPRLDWTPRFFTVAEATLVKALVETILPRTETPGGLDVNLDVFLDRLVADTYDEASQSEFRSELAALNQRAGPDRGADFADLGASDREAFLRQEEKTGGKFNPGVWGTAVGEQEPVSFYRTLKSTLLWGYLSSEPIGREVLRYDPVPGVYVGCIPLGAGERSWSF
ncbi:MAG: gluconate 2-dehydrogenase subunit 3 family protein [Bacteroidota bacterium]